MSNAYSDGYRAGCWTREQLQDGNLTSEQALENVMRDYRYEMDNLENLIPGYRENHAEYMRGVLQGAKDSLRGL